MDLDRDTSRGPRTGNGTEMRPPGLAPTSVRLGRALGVVALTVGLALGVAHLMSGVAAPPEHGGNTVSPAQGAAASVGAVALLVGIATILRAARRTIDALGTRTQDEARLAWQRFERHKSEHVLALSLLGSSPVAAIPILHDLPPSSTNPEANPATAQDPANQPAKPTTTTYGQSRTPAADLTPSEPAAAPPAAPAPELTPRAGAEWLVREGDSFWRLASIVVSDALGARATLAEIDRYWRVCVEQNRSELRPPFDPDLIFPAQVVQLPAPTWISAP